MHHINEAHRLIHLFNVGPRALARAGGVSSPATAAAWRAGRKQPGTPEARAAIELALGIPREAWELRAGHFATQGQLELWLFTHPACRRHDHTTLCTVCAAYEANPQPAARGQVSLAELAAVANGTAERAPEPAA